MTEKRQDPGAPIVVCAYDLTAALYEHVNRFPRAQRTLLGRLILDQALKLLADRPASPWKGHALRTHPGATPQRIQIASRNTGTSRRMRSP